MCALRRAASDEQAGGVSNGGDTREGNEDEVLIELRQAGSSATLLSAQLAALAAEAQRAAEEL